MTATEDHATDRRSTVDRLESEVRSYSRLWPQTFRTAHGATVIDDHGQDYLDFFAGAGALNYGHNNPAFTEALIEYLSGGGILHSLDVTTEAKVEFLEALERYVFAPRGMQYRVQFPGPTGTNAVEAAMKLARKVTGRHTVACFTNAFHGMSLGALAATGAAGPRAGAGQPLGGTVRLPFDGYLGPDTNTLELFERMLGDPSSGLDHPAAVLLETTQAEGGINTASSSWLVELQRLCRENDMLLIVDDIQVGCGRTGPFFSFERADLRPDIVCLSKSISGLGLPLSLVLIDPAHDIWSPGEHNGTFRGNNAAFVTGRVALERYWADDVLSKQVDAHHQTVMDALAAIKALDPSAFGTLRGAGLIAGIECTEPTMARRIAANAFGRGLIIELAGARDEVVKVLPPLTIDGGDLDRGLAIMHDAAAEVLGGS
ncbi:MAG: diaminobutyrate--2-oxoglutarate transaminase [Actinomycetota bacterium]